LVQEAGLGIGVLAHSSCSASATKGRSFGNIMPMNIDSKQSQCLSKNYNSAKTDVANGDAA
jgi:hypothetical protein